MPDTVDNLIKALMRLPGIGPRQAERFVFFLLQHPDTVRDIRQALDNLLSSVEQCSECFRYSPKKASRGEICDICFSNKTECSTLLVVEKDVDFANVHKSGIYKGLYFLLGGLVPILDKEPEKIIRARELVKRVEVLTKTGLKEVILALSANPTGDHTLEYLREKLAPVLKKHNITLSVLGRGLSTGTEIEYSDSDTLSSALSSRKTF